jgi:Protein of unknown function (DUF4197)
MKTSKILAISVGLGALGATFGSCDQLKKAATAVIAEQMLSSLDVGNGLKEALVFGITNGSDLLSKKGGYMNSPYKILLPPEARQITDKLKMIPGFNSVEASILEKINAGAEDAAVKAKPIFINAIKSMSFSDAMGILMGDKNAATAYLKKATYNELFQAFSPVIAGSLDKFNARSYWSDAVNTYNKIPLVTRANPKLEDYVTTEALKGLFTMVEDKEKNIRGDKSQRTTDLMQKVFAKQDKQ